MSSEDGQYAYTNRLSTGRMSSRIPTDRWPAPGQMILRITGVGEVLMHDVAAMDSLLRQHSYTCTNCSAVASFMYPALEEQFQSTMIPERPGHFYVLNSEFAQLEADLGDSLTNGFLSPIEQGAAISSSS